jgi:hypothetical protein
MALIMRWLHPDLASDALSSSNLLDRSLFARRITQAWETVKTDERRAAYNTSLAAKSPPRLGKQNRSSARTIKIAPRTDARKSDTTKQLVMQRVKSRGFWSRLRFLLGGGHA